MLGWWALGVLPVTLVWFAVGARKHVDHLAWAATEDRGRVSERMAVASDHCRARRKDSSGYFA